MERHKFQGEKVKYYKIVWMLSFSRFSDDLMKKKIPWQNWNGKTFFHILVTYEEKEIEKQSFWKTDRCEKLS